LWLPVFVGSGAIGYFQLVEEPSLNKLLALTALSALIIWQVRYWRVGVLVGAASLAFSLGMVFAKLETLRLGTNFIPQEIIVPITARILTWEEQDEGGHRLVVRIITAERETENLGDKKIRLSARSLPEGVQIGAGLSGLVSLRPPSGPVRPGAYDFGFHHYYRGLSAQGFFMGHPQLADLPPPTSLREQFDLALAALRAKLDARIKSSIKGEAGAIASALITGQRGGIREETNQALRISGLAHILSISGLHMAMVTGMALLIARAFLGLFTNFCSRHSPRKIAAGLALGFSYLYLLLSGADIAAQRSFIMVAVMLLAVLCDRSAITMRNLSLSALVILAITPHEILSPSFQMSFAATGALIAAFGWWSQRQGHRNMRPKNGLLRRFILLPVFSTLVASLVAGSASGLFAAYHFANVAPLGLISNVAALPLMSILIMPGALIACLLMPFGLENLPLTLMGMGIEGVKQVSFWVARLSPDLQPAMISPLALLLSSLALVIFLFVHSPLRIMALIPLAAGFTLYLTTPRPLVMIDEKADLIAVATQSGQLALSRPRGRAFILTNWLPVFNKTTQDIILPEQEEMSFHCTDLTCQTTMADGKIFAVALGKGGQQAACTIGDIVLLNYISAEQETCGDKAYSINLRDLARHGSAMIYSQTEGTYQNQWVYDASLRPWNAHRYHAKAILGIP